MTTKHRFRNGKYRLELREKDHGPMHVHLTGGGFDVLIELGTLETKGRWPKGLRREVMEWVGEHHDDLIKEWNKWPR